MIVCFESDPVTRSVVHPPKEADGKRHQVVEPWAFFVDSAKITVPVGFWTDWASIPKPCRAILDRDGPWSRAALAHDFLYFMTYRDDRYFCDQVILHGMIFDRVGSLARTVIYNAVRFGGIWTWERYKRNRYHASFSLAKMPTSLDGMQFNVTVADWDRDDETLA